MTSSELTTPIGDSSIHRLPWLSMGGVILVAAAALVLLRPDLQHRPDAPTLAAPVLRATPHGGSLVITWTARNAGALAIRDGGVWRRVALDKESLAAGQYEYRPTSSEVVARLDVADRAAGMVHVLGVSPAVEAAERVDAAPPQEGAADRSVPGTHDIAAHEAVTPDLLPQAQRSIRGVVRVDVRAVIAADGSVSSAVLEKPAQSPYFNRISLAATQASRFAPANAGTIVLQYEYKGDSGARVTQSAR
jgi:hypothetical protein